MVEKKKTPKIISMAEHKEKTSKTQRYILCPDGSLIDNAGYVAFLKFCIYIDVDPKDTYYDELLDE